MISDTQPTLYDVLGVSREASADEIKAAWREAAERFQPGEGGSTRQFRLFNDAAEVLLDPEQREEYDARLDAAAQTTSASPGPASPTPVPDAPVPGAPGAAAPAAAAAAGGTTRAETDAETNAEAEPESQGRSSRRRGSAVLGVLGVPLTIAVAVVVAIAIGLAAYFVVQAERAEAHQAALDRAPAAAENAAGAVLSYDYESLEADRDAASKFLTPDYRSDYVETFDKLVSDSATETKATVEAKVLASSAMAGSRDQADRVPVLLFVNQTTTSATSEQPSVALNRVRFDMVEVDGTWLVDGITSY